MLEGNVLNMFVRPQGYTQCILAKYTYLTLVFLQNFAGTFKFKATLEMFSHPKKMTRNYAMQQ